MKIITLIFMGMLVLYFMGEVGWWILMGVVAIIFLEAITENPTKR